MKPDRISDKIADFIENETDTKKWFHTWEVEQYCGVVEKKDCDNVRVQLNKICSNGKLLERHRVVKGMWRKIDCNAPALMDFSKIDMSKTVECYLPFHLEDFFKIYPSNVFIVSGVSNYGKTELLLMTAYLNQQTEGVFLNTDADAEEMLARISAYQPYDAWHTKFPRKVVSEEIPELIDRHYKNQFVFVDYLKVVKDYFEISGLIEQCGQAIGRGLLFIGLQKNKGVDWARGGQQTLDLARFYVNLDPGPPDRVGQDAFQTTEMKIIKMKMLKHHQYNPNGWKFIYRFIYEQGDIPTYKMLYEPPLYTEFQGQRKSMMKPKPEVIEVNLDQDVVF